MNETTAVVKERKISIEDSQKIASLFSPILEMVSDLNKSIDALNDEELEEKQIHCADLTSEILRLKNRMKYVFRS